MIQLILFHLKDARSRKALEDAFGDISVSLEKGDLIDLRETIKHVIRKYTDKPKNIIIIPGRTFSRDSFIFDRAAGSR